MLRSDERSEEEPRHIEIVATLLEKIFNGLRLVNFIDIELCRRKPSIRCILSLGSSKALFLF